ncbi:adenylate cyclase type 8-like [Ctenocephalides felis]|uniref:adenylate cyclase type 8-like n=1 Tax=Ctenocephalides felis TaxID=7515 RepID=UPI000E6E28DB|nr:adenylate cyclase type 8-like [Ctenocephalides felis]
MSRTSIVRGETKGVEIATRNSINNLVNNKDLKTLEAEGRNTDKSWNLQNLRDTILTRDLEVLYKQYSKRLEYSHISIFLYIFTSLNVVHIGLLLYNKQDQDINYLIDYLCYGFATVLVWPLLGLLFYSKLHRKFHWAKYVISSVAIFLLVVSDLAVPLGHWGDEKDTKAQPVRPARASIAILTCHLLIPVLRNLHTVIMGFTITASHLAVLTFITHRDQSNVAILVVGDALYLICINALCIYFRYIREILLRRIFLDRRACLETAEQLKYEQDQEERLMLSILPEYIMQEMKADIRNACMKLIGKHDTGTIIHKPRSPFKDIYAQEFLDVSILYADIVNYTQMTTRLSARELVETLNELFGHFDKASERHNVLRIKFLGDCYYCVSGVPKHDPRHARNCVDLGLEMITIIGEVRRRRSLDVDMRIGVHSGNVISGVLGAKKWQYDIWSRDVKIANIMESTGAPGKVHVTKQTLDLLDGKYKYEPSPKKSQARTHPLLVENNIETFLISTQIKTKDHIPRIYQRQVSKTSHESSIRNEPHSLSLNIDSAIVSQRRTFMNSSSQRSVMIQQKADEDMLVSIDELPIGDFRQFTTCNNCSPMFTIFKNSSWELPYMKQNDPLFKYYVAAACFVLIIIIMIERLSLVDWDSTMCIIFLGSAIILFITIILSWSHWMWHKYDTRDRSSSVLGIFRKSTKSSRANRTSIAVPGRLSETSSPDSPQRKPKWAVTRALYLVSRKIVTSAAIRSFVYCGLILILATCAMINLHFCDNLGKRLSITRDEISALRVVTKCTISVWFTTYSVSLVIMMCFMFYKIHYLLKLSTGLTVIIIYYWIIWFFRTDLYSNSSSWNATLDPRWAHTLTVSVVFLMVFATDRQCERVQRLDFRWKQILLNERESFNTAYLVNKVLLANILPQAAANYFLDPAQNMGELYYEEHPNVAVLFASITDAELVSGEEVAQLSEKGVLGVLNTIICAFDTLLFQKRKFSVEKIKMSGWTYMAACGLRKEENPDEGVVLVLAEFASDMISALRIENRSTFQTFKLRIGIDYGNATAGVVGAKKPLYDIWGHAVNMASRLDTTGQAGKIQVNQRTAQILARHDVQCEYRDEIFIKGKGMTTTYFVRLGENDRLLKKPSAIPIQPNSYVKFEETTEEATKM